jgi:hypothetical protein
VSPGQEICRKALGLPTRATASPLHAAPPQARPAARGRAVGANQRLFRYGLWNLLIGGRFVTLSGDGKIGAPRASLQIRWRAELGRENAL